MAEVVVRGTVVGDAGTPVAGWVSLGKQHPQRWLSRELRITSDDGHEITLEDLGGDSIAPVVRRELTWAELEKDAQIASLLAREAPAPDVEVDLGEAFLRGGDRVAAWGVVSERGYVGGESQRGSVEGGITRLRVRAVCHGPTCDALLEKRKEALLERERKAAANDQRPAGDKPAAAARAKRNERAIVAAVFSRVMANAGLSIAIAGLVTCAIAALLRPVFSSWLTAAAVVAWAPVAFDSVLLPRFRNGTRAPTSLQYLFVPWVIAAIITVFLVFSFEFDRRVNIERAETARSFFVLSTALLVGGLTLGMFLLTRSRRRYLDILAKAPPHGDPIQDGVWGASAGRFSEPVLLIGIDSTASGSGKNITVRESAFCNLTPQAPLLRENATTIHVQLGDAAILTLDKTEQDMGGRTTRRAQLIDARTPVLAAGRATDGVLRKGGEASLIVFASTAGTDVRQGLGDLRRRDRIAGVLALVGVACVAGAFVTRFVLG